jgi:hypothetical protein
MITAPRSFRLSAICVICLLGSILAVQGWKSYPISLDLVSRVNAAQALIEHGHIPDRGTISDFLAYAPPGSVWLMLPGMLLFKDCRLFESFSSLALYCGTIAGIFVLARIFFGSSTALLAALLFAFSSIGLGLGQSFGSKSHPFFYVWMVYFLARWMRQRDAKYLVFSLVSWGVGVYVLAGIEPAILIIPAIWFLRRPPLKSSLWIPAATLLALIWFPYLRFEAKRGLVDIAAQALGRSIAAEPFRQAMCQPKLQILELNTLHAARSLSVFSTLSAAAAKGFRVAGILRNFDQVTSHAWVAVLLLLSFMGAAFTLASQSIPGKLRPYLARLLLPAGAILFLIAALVGYFFLTAIPSAGVTPSHSTRDHFATIQLLALVIGVLLLIGSLCFRKAAILPGGVSDFPILLLFLVIPWMAMMLVERPIAQPFYWLWPLQVVILAAFATHAPDCYRASLFLSRSLGLLIFFAIVWNPVMISKISGWRQAGWAGNDSPMVQTVDFIASRIKASKLQEPKIGYDLYLEDSQMLRASMDPNYRIGSTFDLLFYSRHRISNPNCCIEGFSNSDQFRILQSEPEDGLNAAILRINEVPGLTPIRQIGRFYVESSLAGASPGFDGTSLSGIVLSSAVQLPFVSYSDVPDAIVMLYGPTVLRTTTMDDGHYIFSNLPRGRYLLQVLRNGFTSYSETVQVEEKPLRKDVSLTSLISIDSARVKITPSRAAPGSVVTLHYTITNRTSNPVQVALGGCIYEQGTSTCSFGNPESTDIVQAIPGTATYLRKYALPPDVPLGTWDFSARIWGNPPGEYDPLFDGSDVKRQILTITKQNAESEPLIGKINCN